MQHEGGWSSCRKQVRRSRPRRSAQVAVAAASALVLFTLVGCGRESDTDKAKTSTDPAPAVFLSIDQLRAVKIAPASIHSFPVRKEVFGSISYPDDPALIQAESTLLATAASYELSQRELARVKSLGTANGIARKELEQAVYDAQTAAAAYKAARDAVHALGKSDAEVDRMVEAGRIESPAAASRAVKWVVADVIESDSPLFHAGQPLQVGVTAFPDQKFDGAVSEVYSTVDPSTHRVTLRGEVQDPKNELRPGMLADVVIQVRQPEIAIGVPVNGIVREGDGTMTAWVTVDRRHFIQRVVVTGLREDGEVQILRGLQRGELIVTDGAIFLDNMLQAPVDD